MDDPGASTAPVLHRPLRPETLRVVRQDVRSYAESAGLVDPALYNFVMAVNELITNALHHAGGDGQLRLWRSEGWLICQVRDGGPGIPTERLTVATRPPPGTIGGWGLWLVRQVCTAVDIDTGPTGSRITVRYPLSTAA